MVVVASLRLWTVQAGGVTNCSAPDLAMDAEELQMVNTVNDAFGSVHSQAGVDADLQRAASWMAWDLATNTLGQSGHQDSLGRGFQQRIQDCGFDITYGVGEAITPFAAGSPSEAIAYWQDYQGDPLFGSGGLWEGLGVARYPGSGGGWFWVVTVSNHWYDNPFQNPTPTAPPATATSTPTPTPSATATPEATDTTTPTATATSAPTDTATSTPSATPSATSTPPPTASATAPPVGIGQGWQRRSDLPAGPLPAVLDEIGGCQIAAIYGHDVTWQRWLRDAPPWAVSLDALESGVAYWIRGECGPP
jgi:hypothetical protein